MTRQKWGESFLKSGLPLEHVALLSLRAIGWECELHWEYQRVNREGKVAWFEVDLIGYSPAESDPQLRLLVECKYHDQARFWFFLPCETEDHLAQHEALSAGEHLYSDSNVVHSAPYELLANPESQELLALAPKAVWGVTVSQDGTRQENTVEIATKQLAYAFAPYCLEHLYPCNRSATSVLPVIVTSAQLYRIRPEISDLARIRDAASPTDVADEVSWLWYYHAPNGDLLRHNRDEIDRFKQRYPDVRRKAFDDQLVSLWSGPHWIVVATIERLGTAIEQIHRAYVALPKDHLQARSIAAIQQARIRKRKKRGGA